MDTLLIIDDEPMIRKLLSKIMQLEGYEVYQAADCTSALRELELRRPQVVVCDVFLPDGNGIDFIQKIKNKYPAIEVILLTAHGNISDGVKAIKNGAFDYITKGDDNNKIIPSFKSIIGLSESIQNTLQLAAKVATTDVPVLLTGETGTGKEVFAQAIHSGSLRREKPFLAVNCSAFSKDLLENELFGHKSGSFTGATKDKKGLFEEANHGTLFLDEVGEMSFELQAKLLRVLEEGEFYRIGDTRPTKIDVRIISATNRDLKKEIENNTFRQDLFFRLSVFQIMLPALRDRAEDIPALCYFMLEKSAAKIHKSITGITPECMSALKSYSWPGNIRELRNVMERGAIICESELTLEDLPIEMQNFITRKNKEKELSGFELAAMEKNHIKKVLQHTRGNKTEASRLMKIGLTTLYRKIEEYGIEL
ncbi:MAG: sigma-54 dependent transcriptional regulator [Bacteroidales bacterium]